MEKKRGGLWRWLVPRRGRWRWAAARVAVAACLLVVFRYHVLACLVTGHNAAWKAVTGSRRNHAGDVELLLRLRKPGVRALLWIGEAQALSSVRDAGMIPTLLDVARSSSDPRARAFALQGLASFCDERILDAGRAALDDGDVLVRRAAVELVVSLGDERDAPLLRAAAEVEPDSELKARLGGAVASLLPQPGPAPRQGELLPAESTVKVAVVQFMSEMGKPELNRRRLEVYIREAARNGAKIVVLPETAITGYMDYALRTAWRVEGRETSRGVSGVSPASAAETVPGPSTRAFAALAKELGIYLTIPLLEKDSRTGSFYNSVVLADPGGALVLHYRKLNPWPWAERGWAARGDRGLQVTDTRYGRLALLICYDINFEPPRLLKAGVDTLLYPIAWVDTAKSGWFHGGLPRVARDNRLNILGANWTVPAEPGWHGYGQSLVIDHAGRVLARARQNVGEEIVYGEIPVPARAGERRGEADGEMTNVERRTAK